MQAYQILWVDDEIDLLQSHIAFLRNKGYHVTPISNGTDALDLINEETFDLVLLDENLIGMRGLEVLEQIKQIQPNLPVVMITKSEEEQIMEEAIGAKIADYLVKPTNNNQILSTIKKILDNKRLIAEKVTQSYQQDFRLISMAYQDDLDHEGWANTYKKLVFWELEIEETQNKDMFEVLEMQKSEANSNFVRFIAESYEEWLNSPDAPKPLLSHQLMRKKVFPYLKQPEPLFFILIDNLRFDQWRMIEPLLLDDFKIEEDTTYYSILPTTTAYARNAIFAGMTPADMAKYHPDIWIQEDDEEGKNLQEEEFLRRQLHKNKLDIKFSYHKIITQNQGKTLLQNLPNLYNNAFNAIVFNFVDMLSHARTDSDMIRELMPDEPAYRSLTKSWFAHSPVKELLEKLAERSCRVIITTDHGTIRVKKPFKIIGDKNVNTNLRYKQGKNLSFKQTNDVLVASKPEKFMLPRINVSTTYVFATEDNFFAYPNNYNHYVSYYKDTFQHGGISLEEMILPFVVLKPK